MAEYLHNPVGAPIPGQSLTGEPGSKPWEQPPQFTNPTKAATHLISRLMSPKSAMRSAMIMESGVMKVTTLTEITLMDGVMEGKWTIDMAMLMADPVFMTFAKIAKNAGIQDKVKWGIRDPNDFDEEDLKGMLDLQRKLKDATQGPSEDVPAAPSMEGPPMEGPPMEGPPMEGPPMAAPPMPDSPMAPTANPGVPQ